MAKKIELYSGLGGVSPIFSIASNLFYFYGSESDRKKLHEKYGGKQYHFGNYEKGYITPSPEKNDTVLFGYYRTDARGEQHREVVASYTTPGGWSTKEIFGYVPFNYFERGQGDGPFVLTDGETVGFFRQSDVLGAMKDWGSVVSSSREIQLTLWGSGGESYTPVLKLYNPHHLGGVDALRFFDLREYRKSVTGNLIDEGRESFKLLEVKEVYDGERRLYLFYNQSLGVYDNAFGVDPTSVKGELVKGWVGDGEGLIWRRQGDTVQVLLEIPWSEMAKVDSKFIFEREDEWIDFEETVPALEWFSVDETARRERLMNGILRKAENVYENHQRVLVYATEKVAKSEKLLGLLEANRELVIGLADSYAVGNCKPGTERFCKLFGIEGDSVTVGQLLDHKKFSLMLANERFEAVLWHALKEAGLVEEIEMSKSRRQPRRITVEDEVSDDILLGESTLARMSGSNESE